MVMVSSLEKDGRSAEIRLPAEWPERSSAFSGEGQQGLSKPAKAEDRGTVTRRGDSCSKEFATIVGAGPRPVGGRAVWGRPAEKCGVWRAGGPIRLWGS